MNKRFFTLMAAVLLAGAPLCNEAFAVTTPVDLAALATPMNLADGLKFVIAYQTTPGTNAGYIKVKSVEGTAFVTVDLANESDPTKATVFEIRNYSGGKFELWANGKQFVTKKSGTSGTIEVFDPNTATDITKEFVAKKRGTVATTTDFNELYTFKVGELGTQLWSAVTLVPNTLSETLDASGLKEINSSSTSFNFGADAVEGNVFDGLTPVTRGANTIFVKGTSDDIKSFAADQTNKDKAAKVSVVYVKNEKWGLNDNIHGTGYKLTLINGAEFFDTTKPAHWENAEFTSIKEGDRLNAEGEIELSISPIVGTATTGVAVKIAAVKASASDTKTYVTTIAAGSTFAKITNPSLGGNTYFSASEFLSTEKSVYNVYFTSGKPSVKGGIVTEYHKYLTVTSNGATFNADALAANDVQTDSPLAQWIVTGFDGKYTLTLTNRQTMRDIVLKLNATSTAGIYKIVSTSGSAYTSLVSLNDQDPTNGAAEKALADKEIMLVKTNVSKTDGALDLSKEDMAAKVALVFSGKTAQLGETSFVATPHYDDVNDEYDYLYPSQDQDQVRYFGITKTNDKVLNEINYAYINAKGQIVADAIDTLQIPVYNISYSYYKVSATTPTVAYVQDGTLKLNEETTAGGVVTPPTKGDFIFLKAMNGSYVMAEAGVATATVGGVTTNAPSNIAASAQHTYVKATSSATTVNFAKVAGLLNPSYGNFSYVDVVVREIESRTSLEAASRHATLESTEGAISFRENKNGILEGILSAEPMTFWLDTADSEAVVPAFYISKGIAAADEEAPATKAEEALEMRNFLFYAADSLNIFDEGSAMATKNEAYYLENTKDLKAIFRPAALIAEDTLATVVDGKEVTLKKSAVKPFQFGIVLADEDVEGEYVVYSKKDPSMYLYSHNGKLGFGSEGKAMIFTIGEGDATANEAIAAESNVQVIGGQGVVTVQGAAGKVITVANILGQTIANQVAASDNVTIAAPAGVVVVVVDGDATKVVVK